MYISRLVSTAIPLAFYSIVMIANAETANFQTKPASPATQAAQETALVSLPEDDNRDMEFASRGFIATVKDPIIYSQDGRKIWDVNRYNWVKGPAPATVNPSLWRHVQVLSHSGLFKVADGVYQVRGLDPTNMTVVEGKTGRIIIDPLYSRETAKVAIDLVNQYLGKRAIKAVIYSHSHPDHFGGVRGIVDEGDGAQIIAPDKFLEETASEFLLAGNAAGRRASYQLGTSLTPGPRGRVSGGIVEDPAPGTLTLIKPTDYIYKTGETRVIDGVNFEFQMVPDTEAPAEMNIYLPDSRVMFISEIVSCTMHNLQAPRGSQVRDALSWADYLTEALDRYGDRSDALVTGHCWPRFGNAELKEHLRLQRDNYMYIHDQVVRLFNKGETPLEIADEIKQPKAVANEWSNHGYYGNLKYNAMAVHQYYMGWWDGIPAHLDLLPPAAEGKHYVEAIGGANKVLKLAEKAMAKGNYRWSAQVLNNLVFAEPDNKLAKAKLADSYEQLGYQAESAIFRNFYLSGAQELRGHPASRHPQTAPDIVRVTPVSSFLDLIATMLNPEKVGDKALTINLDITDPKEQHLLTLRNAVLVNREGKTSASPDITLSATKQQLIALFLRHEPLEKLQSQGLKASGDLDSLILLQSALEIPPQDYPIIVP